LKDINEKRNNKTFCFDDVFSAEVLQTQVYDQTAKSLTKEVLQGYNGTVLAYGQTGSGKTHTMMGNLKQDQEKGIIPRCFESILDDAKSNNSKDFLIMCSYMEIYN
jgi:type II secretory ATPase GspE/PulE/Tfp pilus assembly ATPase PilB-like protein